MFMSRTELGRLFQSANSLDILVYVHEHPGCYRSDVYRNVTRNAHTREKIDMMEDYGLLELTPYGGNGMIMSLTDKGKRLFDLIMEAEAVLKGPSDGSTRDQPQSRVRSPPLKQSCSKSVIL